MHTVIESLIVPSEARESVNSEVDYWTGLTFDLKFSHENMPGFFKYEFCKINVPQTATFNISG
jgi:hypothetical protein